MMVSACIFPWSFLFKCVAVSWLCTRHVPVLFISSQLNFPKTLTMSKIPVIYQNLCSVQEQRSQGHRKATGFVCSCMAVEADFLADFGTIAPFAQISRVACFSQPLVALGLIGFFLAFSQILRERKCWLVAKKEQVYACPLSCVYLMLMGIATISPLTERKVSGCLNMARNFSWYSSVKLSKLSSLQPQMNAVPAMIS